MKRRRATSVALILLVFTPVVTFAQERLCDPQYEDCRQPIIDLIRAETKGIDVAFWFMADSYLASELIKRHQAGVPVRILMDQRANASKPANASIIASLRDAGIPMRDKFGQDILHFKMMLFDGQNVVNFSKANFSDESYVPSQPYVNYTDEAVFFTNDTTLTNSFRRRFDDRWIDTTVFQNFGNITAPLARRYPVYTIAPAMNFVPLQDFGARAVGRYDLETQRIDAIVFRVTDSRHSDAMVRAVARGVPVRLISEPDEYRNPVRLNDAKYIDLMYMGGVQIKMRAHMGFLHEAAVVMQGLGEVIFGSSNWTPQASIGPADEHNYFYKPSLNKPWFFQWFADQFDHKWNDAANYVPFQPLPPDPPVYSAPLSAGYVTGTTATLTWDGGTWAHLYDIYFGTSANPPLVATNQQIGAPDNGVIETFQVSNLQPGTTYYWRIVGKTWAQKSASGPTWSFTTTTGTGTAAYLGTPAAIPGTFQAENFDEGGQSAAYYDTKLGNSGGVYRNTDVDIGPSNDAGGGYYVGWTRAGEWLKYTVNVATTGTYTFEARVANVGTGGKFHMEVDGADKTGAITLPDTGGWDVWQTVPKTGISLTAGQHVIRVAFDTAASSGGVGNYNWFRFTSESTPPPPPPPSTAYGGTPVSLPGVVQVENFDTGAQNVAYFDASAGNSGGVYRTTDVDIGPTADAGSGGYYVGWTRIGEWLTYSVNVTTTRNYTLSARVANVGTGATFRIEVDGVDKTGPISVINTGGWDIWQTITKAGISLTQGQHVIRLVMVTRNNENSGVGNFGYLSFQ